jgi:hypothetical protein
MAVLQLRRMLTGNVPGNEASYGDTCVFGGSPGTDVQASTLSVNAVDGNERVDEPENNFLRDLSCACTSIPTTTCHPGQRLSFVLCGNKREENRLRADLAKSIGAIFGFH